MPHKEQAISILCLLSSLSLGAFACPVRRNDCTGVAKKTFRSMLNFPFFPFNFQLYKLLTFLSSNTANTAFDTALGSGGIEYTFFSY